MDYVVYILPCVIPEYKIVVASLHAISVNYTVPMAVMYDKTFPRKSHHTMNSLQIGISIQSKCTDTTKVQFGELMNVIGVTYSSIGERLLTGTEVTQRQLHY